jgi:hypothetical protein
MPGVVREGYERLRATVFVSIVAALAGCSKSRGGGEVSYYGPPPEYNEARGLCADDASCVRRYGPGAICDLSTQVDDGWGNKAGLCRGGTRDGGSADAAPTSPQPTPAKAYYGPPPQYREQMDQCASDRTCTERHGQGWYCDQSAPVDDGWGHKVGKCQQGKRP